MELDDDARRVYRAMLARPGLDLDALAADADLPVRRVRAALDQLADRSLVGIGDGGPGDGAPDAWQPTPPRVALASLAAAAEADILARQQQLADLRAMMESIAAEHESLLQRESLVVHRSRAAARDRLSELALGARVACLSLNPGRTHDASAMAASKPLNTDALARGVSIRAVYQDSSRTDPATLDYARWLTEQGGEIRTAPTVPMLLVVVDSEVALLPRQVGRPELGAVEIRVPTLVASLVEYFELVWLGADPLGTSRHRDVDVSGSMARTLLRLAASGLTDEAAARRLELSTRTVRRMMSDIMAELGASSRFQAGVEAHRRGWLG